MYAPGYDSPIIIHTLADGEHGAHLCSVGSLVLWGLFQTPTDVGYCENALGHHVRDGGSIPCTWHKEDIYIPLWSVALLSVSLILTVSP